MPRDRKYYLKEVWHIFRKWVLWLVLIPLGWHLLTIIPVLGYILVMPLMFFYWIPVGLIFGRPHFYDDTHAH